MNEAEINTRFLSVFRKWIDGHGWLEYGSKGEIAAMLGVSQSQITNILSGSKTASEKQRLHILNKIGVSYQDLIQGIEIDVPTPEIIKFKREVEPKDMIDYIDKLNREKMELYARVKLLERELSELKGRQLPQLGLTSGNP